MRWSHDKHRSSQWWQRHPKIRIFLNVNYQPADSFSRALPSRGRDSETYWVYARHATRSRQSEQHENPPGNTPRSRLRSNPLLSKDRQRPHIRCVRSTMLQNMLRAATARGTRRRGYFAAAVAARSRSRQAIMAAFLRVSLPVSDPSFALSFSLSLSFSFFSRLTLSFRLSFAFFPFVPLPSARSPSSFFVSVASFQFALGFSIPLLATRAGVSLVCGAVASQGSHQRTSTCVLLSYTHTWHMYTLVRPGWRKHFWNDERRK